MKIIKKPFTLLICAILCLSLSSCGSAKYRNDVSCSELCDTFEELSSTEFSEYDSDYISFILKDTSVCDDCCVIYSDDAANVDEFGIFHAKKNADTEKLYEAVSEYVSEMKEDQRTFIMSYAPEEIPKLDGARIERFGNYIVYSISDKKTSNKAISAIENALA